MRIANRLLALVLSLALILAATVLTAEVVAYRLGNDPLLLDWPAAYRWAAETSWGAAPVRLAGIAAAVVGLALLAAQLKPRRPADLPLDTDHEATDVTVDRHGLTRAVRNAVADIDGVRHADVVTRRRRVRVRATTHAGPDAADLRQAVTQAAQKRLDALRLRQSPSLSVRVTAKER